MPDVILIPGDVVLGYFPEGSAMVIDRCGNILPFLRGCAEIAPTYMSVGNHECLLCDEELEILKSTGINLLDNEWTELSVYDKCSEEPGERILIGGLTSAHVISYRRFREQCNKESNTYERYPYRPRPRDIGRYPADSEWLEDFVRQEGYKILLCHHPEYYPRYLKGHDIPLILSGHAHGGQIRIFGQGLFAPDQGIFPRLTSGVKDDRLVISRGLANRQWVPRLFNPTEIVYVSGGHPEPQAKE